MELRVAYKEYFEELKFITIKYKDLKDLDNQFNTLLNTDLVERLDMVYLPYNTYILLDKRADRVPNALGLRSNLIFIRDSDDKLASYFEDLEDEDLEYIKLLMNESPFKELYEDVGKKYYKNREELYFKEYGEDNVE